jgi:hypothetical protein
VNDQKSCKRLVCSFFYRGKTVFARFLKNTNKLVLKSVLAGRHLCNIQTAKKQITVKTKQFLTNIKKAMKKQIKKLAFSTEKIVSLSKTDLQAVNGGTWAPSNGGQSHNCLAITGHRSCIC